MWTKPERPVYRLLVWEGDKEKCRGYIAQCEEQAELVMPLPDRPNFNMLYCRECWKPMRDHLMSQGFEFVVSDDASYLLASSARRRVV